VGLSNAHPVVVLSFNLLILCFDIGTTEVILAQKITYLFIDRMALFGLISSRPGNQRSATKQKQKQGKHGIIINDHGNYSFHSPTPVAPEPTLFYKAAESAWTGGAFVVGGLIAFSTWAVIQGAMAAEGAVKAAITGEEDDKDKV